MDISIVIVNYNVQYFIEQCLNSIFSISNFTGNFEVIVIDNDSSDGSIDMIEQKFPDVTLIKNDQNVGFSVANNQGLSIAKGKYNLLLNPDTIVEEDTLQKCFLKMEADHAIGALGVKMVDGTGKFLPESKRGFPSPLASLYRFTGLYNLFPQSEKINSYYQGHIDPEETAEVEILCGAFMFIRRSVLDEIGFLDEKFFMYGEDIDLSYRIKKAGYKILYFPETTIIHFKGESTKKESVQYTQRFYNAMHIFAEKHFQHSKAASFIKYLSIVISLKAFLNLAKNTIAKLILPFIDTALIFLGLQAVSRLWATNYFQDADYYESAPLIYNFTLYTVVWIIAIFYGGGYDKKINTFRLFRNVLIGTLVILAIYGLLDPSFRSSRAIIFLSTFYVMAALTITRMISRYLKIQDFEGISDGKNLIIIANNDEAKNIEAVLLKSNNKFNQINILPPNVSTYELQELIQINNIDEVICNIKDVGMRRVIELMSFLGSRISFKITGDESLGIVGSQSKNRSGEIYTIEVQYAIQNQNKIRSKRTFDIITTIVIMIFFPITIIIRNARKIMRSSVDVLAGYKTIIGYDDVERANSRLPILGAPIIKIDNAFAVDYARNYTVWKDLRYLWKSIFLVND